MLFTIFGLGKKNCPYFQFHNVGRSDVGWCKANFAPPDQRDDSMLNEANPERLTLCGDMIIFRYFANKALCSLQIAAHDQDKLADQ